MAKTRVSPFEFQILKALKALEIKWSGQTILLAFSGGRDSVSLLNLLTHLQPRLGFKLELVHVHHGFSNSKKVATYRKKALAYAKKTAAKSGLLLHLIEHSDKVPLESEAEFRKFREAEIESLRKKIGATFVAYGHHADDLLETRLIRLIRGTGPQGLQAMSLCHGTKLRPLLSVNSSSIDEYARVQKLKWINDPTNKESVYFRNWIRNKWLPQLEKKRSGSIRALNRSLSQLAETVNQSTSVISEQSRLEVISRKEFASLTLVKKREVVARIMLEQGARDFSRRQIDEILKRLSSRRGANPRKMSFEVGGLHWSVNAEQIEARRLQ